ncbi:MAG: hypothetical protein JWO38_1534 [Gemmataceae bacterium]|nr:hypothetical protein [Gemmataceae bacterium]
MMCDQELPEDFRGDHDDGPGSPVRARAAGVLGVPPDPTPATARAAFVRRLADTGLVPPEECVAATNTLVGTTLPLGPAAADGSVGRDVEQFTAEFWFLPPPGRRARWAELSARCTDRPAARRLRQVEAGLDVAAIPHRDPVAAEVASFARELFLLAPRDRAVRRVTWLVDRAARFGDLTRAARLVLKHDMPTARLDPRLFDWFALGRYPTPVAARAPTDRPTNSLNNLPDTLIDKLELYLNKFKSVIIRIFVALIAMAIPVFAWVSSPSGAWNQPGPITPLPVDPPAIPRPSVTPEQIEAFAKYDRDGQKGPPPPGYTMFRLSGGQIRRTPPGGSTPSGTSPTKPR